MERICHPGNRRGRDPGPGVFATKLHDALLASPETRYDLGGGSVTLDGRLILVAPLGVPV
ncbi:hypothetical protein ACFY20_34820 [Streptomyces sp. NPDC001312]|uniref:hypothetical protein n=1 Tax=Streptomyces sp. NPDC001312 TaxID=3364561 RepID=UPI0036BC7D06